jgi:hypothetical protein
MARFRFARVRLLNDQSPGAPSRSFKTETRFRRRENCERKPLASRRPSDRYGKMIEEVTNLRDVRCSSLRQPRFSAASIGGATASARFH